MNKHEQFKAEYEGFVSFLKRYVPDVDEYGVLVFFTAAVLKIWGSNLLYSPDYTTLLRTVTGQPFTVEQVVTSLSSCGDPERVLRVPAFFDQIIEQEWMNGGRCASECVSRINDLLVGAAMINGDFTIEEAMALSQIIDSFVSRAEARGRKVVAVPDNYRRITEPKEDSYLQNDALLAEARQAGKAKPDPAPKPSGEDPAAPFTITLHLSGSDGSILGASNTQAAPPEEAPVVTKPSEEDGETMESLLAELDGLVGLTNVKQDVHSLMNFIKVTKIREQRGMKVPTVSYHLVFTGNPGTGKTTVARLVAKLYYHLGILPQGQLVETDRSALVAGYLGQTAIKTQKVIQQAMGGVLFIDEAYSLAGETDDSYGKEAIETILKAMEDHRNELIVIVAGYTELMHKFIRSNPGLSSRFSKYFEFPDYEGSELLAIFERFCSKNGYVLAPDAADTLKAVFDRLYEARDSHFGNARTARNIFEKAINAQADRIAAQSDFSDAALTTLTAEDISVAVGGAA